MQRPNAGLHNCAQSPGRGCCCSNSQGASKAMSKHGEFKLLKIQTHILKVNIHCDGCKLQVRKILHRTEGVFSVSIDVEEQKVTVSGDVDAMTLIRKLNRAGKHAEPWPAKTSKDERPNQQKQGKPVYNAVKVDDKIKESSKISLQQGNKSFRNQKHKLSSSSSDEYDSDYDDDVDDDEEEEEELEEDGDEEEEDDYKGQMRNTNAAANNKMLNSQGINGSDGGVQQQFPAMMVNMQACQSQPPSMVNYWIGQGMAMQENRHLQPQMMYLKSPAMAAYTGYCNYYQSPYYLSDQVDAGYHCYYPSGNANNNACSIM